jgi:uncharacterized protein YdeI (YjbR/CyaY-like superfamily)
MSRDPRVDAYIETKAAAFAQPLLTHFRDVIHARCPAIEETIRWGMPSFSYRNRPFAGMAAFKAHVSFGFWDLHAGADKGERDGMGHFGKVTAATMPSDAALIAKIDEALALADSPVPPKRAKRAPKPEAEVPAMLAEALAGDTAATANWNAFSPSCRREYCEWVADAKRDETRAKRVATTIAQAREGKKLNWKYENC